MDSAAGKNRVLDSRSLRI